MSKDNIKYGEIEDVDNDFADIKKHLDRHFDSIIGNIAKVAIGEEELNNILLEAFEYGWIAGRNYERKSKK